MIGQIITDLETGKPLDNNSNELAVSSYQPPEEIKELFARVQQDYQIGYSLQHRPFDEFDGVSLLQRARLDQQTFAAFVGATYVPHTQRWRWTGRKNTSRNKLINLLSRAIAGMLYPFVYAKNDKNEEDKMTARVMRILIEDHLKKAKYKTKFLFMVLSALVNPAVFCEVEYVEYMQSIKEKVKGEWKITEIVDDLLSGLALNIIPIDEVFLPDVYSGTGRVQHLPNILRVQRISYDEARAKYTGKHFYEGVDLFNYVKAGMTRIVMSGQEGQTLFDIEWTEADPGYVQVITARYRPEDLELTWVGGVGIFNYENPYNTNPFEHRRMTLYKGEWKAIPVYPIAMSGFEPIDPVGRFAFYKSGAFKEFWDDKWLNNMDRFLHDGTALDIFKPIFGSGVTQIDQTVMVPGAFVPIPMGATISPYSIGPNLSAAYQAVAMAKADLEDSTQSQPVPTDTKPGVTATQIDKSVAQARIFFTVFSLMLADLVEQVGALSMDCVVRNTTVGEIDASVPENLKMKLQTYLAKGKEKGKDVTHKIIFDSNLMGQNITREDQKKKEWDLYNKSGQNGKERYTSEQRSYLVNPYQFARTTYTMSVDADQIVLKSMGAERSEKDRSYEKMMDPRAANFIDQKAVVDDFLIDEYGGDDPDRYKRKDDMMSAVMGNPAGAPVADGGVSVPSTKMTESAIM